MSKQSNESSKIFLGRVLPWIVGGAALLVYLLTLNPWVTFNNLPQLAGLAGWEWRPTVTAPLHYLLTLPIRWLPLAWQPFAANLFASLCAALTLALLARSVRLLPQDRTRDQRQKEVSEFSLLTGKGAWVPPVLAAALCGLQFTFWENSTVGTGEMLNLVLFAYVTRCLLEFRLSQQERWLFKFSFVYGLATTNNWAMIGFAPLFLTSIVWIKGLAFFNLRFLIRMVLSGLAGLSLYLLLPLVTLAAAKSEFTLWEILRENLRNQKYLIWNVTSLRSRVLWVSLTSIVPLFIIGIRWPSSFADINAIGSMITNLMFRVIHLFFLVIGIAIFFDPPFSGRALGYGLPFLTFYYLTALAVGYLSGYVLIVFRSGPGKGWERPSMIAKLSNRILTAAIWTAVIVLPAALIYKNLPGIHASRSPVLSKFVSLMVEALPTKGAVILSDDPLQLYLIEAAFARAGKKHENLLLEGPSLVLPEYHRYLNRRYPDKRGVLINTNAMPPNIAHLDLVRWVSGLSGSHSVYYLHPSFGYYFERFYLRPHGLVYELKQYPPQAITPPPYTAREVAENEKFWKDLNAGPLATLPKQAKKNPDLEQIAGYYSRALNFWAVEMQKQNLLNEASEHFAEAIRLHPDNVVAQINQRFNANLRGGQVRAIEPDEMIEKKLGLYRTLESALSANGPFDELEFDLRLGQIFARGGNLRQSALYFIRVLSLVPKHLEARVSLAKSYIEMQQPDKGLELIRQVRSESASSLTTTNQFELLQLETLSYLAKNDTRSAEKLLFSEHEQNPRDENRLNLLTEFYVLLNRPTNALEWVDKQLRLNPDSQWALFKKGALSIEIRAFEQAIPALDRLLQLQPSDTSALFNRAIANLQSKRLPDAKRDYEMLEKLLPKPFLYKVYFGLQEIAHQRQDKSGVTKYCKLYLQNAPAGTPEARQVAERLDQYHKGAVK